MVKIMFSYLSIYLPFVEFFALFCRFQFLTGNSLLDKCTHIYIYMFHFSKFRSGGNKYFVFFFFAQDWFLKDTFTCCGNRSWTFFSFLSLNISFHFVMTSFIERYGCLYLISLFVCFWYFLTYVFWVSWFSNLIYFIKSIKFSPLFLQVVLLHSFLLCPCGPFYRCQVQYSPKVLMLSWLLSAFSLSLFYLFALFLLLFL